MKRLLKNFWGSSKFGWRIARIFVLVCVGCVVLIMLFEEKLIYFPAKYPAGFWNTDNLPARDGQIIPKVEDSQFTAEDGVKLHGWYCTPHRSVGGAIEPVPAEMVLLWFHGNAGNISHRYEMIHMLMSLPIQVFIIDYRGYGKSEGSPSEQGLYLDASAAWQYLTVERGIRPEKIIIFGKSLGGVPAIDLATKVEPAGLIVQSSFTSVADMAAAIMPFLPSSLLRTKMDSINKISKVHCRKLFIHSPVDEVIPYDLGRRLYEAAPEPKQFYEVSGAPHNETYIIGGKPYLDAIRSFAQSCAPSKP